MAEALSQLTINVAGNLMVPPDNDLSDVLLDVNIHVTDEHGSADRHVIIKRDGSVVITDDLTTPKEWTAFERTIEVPTWMIIGGMYATPLEKITVQNFDSPEEEASEGTKGDTSL